MRWAGSNAEGASASGYTAPTMGAAVRPGAASSAASRVRSGSTMKKTARPSSGRTRGGSAMVTSAPPGRTSCAERSRISPPITSNTTSTSPMSSSRSCCRSTNASAPRPSTVSRCPARPLPITLAPALARELHRDRTDAACGAVDQDGLPGREMSVVEQTLPCGQPGHRQCRRHHVVDACRQRREVTGLYRNVFRERAIAGPVGEPEDS